MKMMLSAIELQLLGRLAKKSKIMALFSTTRSQLGNYLRFCLGPEGPQTLE
jgi:hypothetical protein